MLAPCPGRSPGELQGLRLKSVLTQHLCFFGWYFEVYSKNRLIFLELVGWNLIINQNLSSPEMSLDLISIRSVVEFGWFERKFLIWSGLRRKSKSTKLLPLGRIGNPSNMDHPKDYSLFGRLDFQGIHKDSWYTQHPKPLPWSRCSPKNFSLRCTRSSVYKLLRSMGIRLDHSSKVMWGTEGLIGPGTPWKK